MAGEGDQDQINGETDHHVISMVSECSLSLERRFKQRPTVLKPSASNYSCCIFRAPLSLVQINEKAYEPQIVSIGPYHHGKKRLNMVEQHKPRFVSALLERTKAGGVGLNCYFNAIALRENEIRDCYSEPLPCESSALIEMMLLDACFIVEVLRILGRVIEPDPDDPLFAMPWIFTFLTRDFIRMENQIPFFVLQLVFDLSNAGTADGANRRSLMELALGFFNSAAQRPPGQFEFNVRHLLDLFRVTFIGHCDLEQPGDVPYPKKQLGDVDEENLRSIPSATQLLRSGVKFKQRKGENLNLVDIQFNHGVLHIPRLTLDEFVSCSLLNCLAFEQSYVYRSRHITSYIVFMRCLLNTEMDVELLSENLLLVNYLGSNAEVATFFNDLGKDTAFDIGLSYLAGIFRQLNKHHQSKWRVRWAGIKREYFGNPWSFISATAAFVLLILTVLQAFYAIFAYYRPLK